MNANNLSRRSVLGTAGAVMIGGTLATGSAAANPDYVAELSGANVEPPVTTNASGEARVQVDEGPGNVRLIVHVDCLSRGESAVLEYGDEAIELGLDDPVGTGLVRDETILNELISDDELGVSTDEFRELLESGDVAVIVTTEQYPAGEIAGPFTVAGAPAEPDEEVEEPDEEEPDTEDDDDPEGRSILITATDAETGDPIEGADVHMASADGDPADAVEFSFTTDSDGAVDEVVEIGNLILTIEAEGYETYSTELSLDEEHHAELEPEDEEGDPDLQDALEVVGRQTDVGHDTNNEYILFENTSDSEVDLSGHVVTDREEGGTGIEASFPDGFTLGPGDQVRVTSGSGSPTDDEIFMNSGRAVWRQDGDEVLIVGPGGNVVFSYSYGDGGTSSIQFVFNQVRSLFA